jgi:hypothetical protein
VDLYDANSDGVVDRDEYKQMVEDMETIRPQTKEKQLQGCASKMRTLNCRFTDNDGAVGFISNPLQRPLNLFSIFSNVYVYLFSYTKVLGCTA